jgi:spermidine synthase
MYHVISIGFTAILLYLISYFFYRIGYYSIQLHRKFWNLILAVTFLITAMAGIFMALQINYKWNIPCIKTILKWHVEFGIGMSFAGLFHFLWHMNYFGKIFNNPEGTKVIPEFQNLTTSGIKVNLFIIGFVSSSVQLLLMRELMNITGGYELITGSFLASWLIGSAIGASIAGKSSLNDIRKINIIFSFSPIISLMLMLSLSRVFLSQGETPSFLVALIYTFLVLISFCMVSGFTFVKLITLAGSVNSFAPGKSFSVETTGGIVSGIVISVLTAGFAGTYKLLLLIILLALAYVFISYYLISPKSQLIGKVIIAVSGIFIIVFSPDILFRQILLPGVKVTETSDTPYGNITKGKYKGEESLYYNQRLLAYKDDVTEREEDIHYAMLQSESPEKVVIISGSLKSHLPEILKYPVKNIIYIERDPALSRYEIPVADTLKGKVVIVNKDAYRYIRNSSEKFDVIILLIPSPSTLLLNRYYTSEFFSAVKKRLKHEGIFMCSPGQGEDYFNKESLNLYSSVYNSLKTSFKNVKPVVGNKLYFIASDKEISVSFCQLAEKRHIQNIYVSSDFLEDKIIAKKSDEVSVLIDPMIKENRSSFPVACFHSQSYRFSRSANEKIPAIIFLFIIFAMPVAAVKRRNKLMYFSASALAGFEIIILLTLQIVVGNMYQLTGLIIACLMAGLAAGSGSNFSFFKNISLRDKVIPLILFYILFGLAYNYMTELKSSFIAVVVIIISGFLPAYFTGSIFRELTTEPDGLSKSPAIYSADLAGSAFGFIFISAIMIPAFGIRISVFLLSVLVITGILLGTISITELKSK